MNVSLPVILVCLAAASVCGCATETSTLERSQELMRRGNYYMAFEVLKQEVGEKAATTDPQYRAIHLAYLLQVGQEEVFNDDEVRAIATFEKALEVDPGNRIATEWIAKANAKLASGEVSQAEEFQRSGELREALLSYHRALGHVPDFPPALEGVEQIAKLVKERQDRAEDHYTRGVAALGEKLWGQTWYHMVNAIALEPEMEKAKARRDLALDRLVADRYQRAQELEQARYYGAALKEYLAIQEQAPDFEGLDEHVAHMRREVEAQRLVREAEMAGFKNDFEKARELLEKAYETTILEQVEVANLLILVKERSSEVRYEKARIMEYENRKEEALEAYKALAEDWKGQGFKDVLARINGLEADIAEAKKAYDLGQQAEAKGDLKAALEAYQDALVFYPGYQQLDAKVEELRAKLK